jgi:dTDP-4-dehydrorhamnose reductase
VRLFVTGGCGYLGAELVRRAHGAGLEVVATWWEREPGDLPGAWHRLDIRVGAAVAAAAGGVDAVVHTAYRQHGEAAWTTNVDGSAAVAHAAAGRRLIHLSSDLVFDGARGRYREEDEPAPVNEYGRSKAEAERLVAEIRPQATIVRTSLLYGGPAPGTQERLALEGTRFYVDEIRSPVRVGDLAEAVLELLAVDVPGPLHLGGPDDVSRYDFAVALGADPDRIEAGRTPAGRAANVSLDSSRARGLLRTRLRGVYEPGD